ncbi:TonB-dependent receptor [Peristeroidobacter soli]|uniref:TonB-dependent receptor n=1 Tax=Peristeroidobacter soli TaxID=2497877 RepID=UPI00158DF836|nr:TonB-dependent receptor [Peristeroidobacter soli]
MNRWWLGCASLILMAAPLSGALAEPQMFELSEGAAAKMLREFGRAAKLQTLFDYELVRNVRTHAVTGKLEPDEALTRMLAGTGLTFQRVDERTIAIRSERSPTTDLGPTIEEIVVASRLLQTAAESAVPVEVYDRPRIERSGAGSVTEFLNTLPSVSVQTTMTGQYQHANGSSTVQLRGLPAGTTLVLINGRRVHSSGSAGSGSFFDLGAIPMSAIERIEVLPSGSSAVYGGDALGGIVNVVLRQGIEDVEFNTRFAQTSDGAYDEQHYSVAAGAKGERWSGSVIATYMRNSELRGSERAVTSTQDFTPYGGQDFRLPYGNPATVCTQDGSNLSGLASNCAAVPAGSSGVGLTPADFAATAGQINQVSFSPYYSMLAPAERYGAFASGTFELSENTELFAEFLYSKERKQLYVYPPVAVIRVPADSPNNPFGQAVSLNYLFEQIGRICGQCQDTDYFRPLLGARGSLFSNWSWEAAAWTSRDTSNIPTGFVAVDSVALNAAVADGSFTPFADGAGGNVDLQRRFFSQAPRKFEGSVDSANAFVRGPLGQWAGGTIEAVLGAEFQRSVFSSEQPQGEVGDNFSFDRNQKAAFAELRAPLYGGGQRAGADVLALQVALRYDDYADFGGRTSVGTGLEFRPIDHLLLRASYSTAFKPPTLYNLYAPTTTFESPIRDPLRGNETVMVTQAYGGNEKLRPETGWSRNLGLVYSPTPQLDIMLTQWHMRLDNGFVSAGANAILAEPDLYPGRAIRAPVEPGDPYGVGRLIYLDQSIGNFGFMDESGVDLQVDWSKATALGKWRPSLALAYVYHYDYEFTPGAGTQDAVSKANDQGSFAPRWKGTAGLSWEGRNAQVGVVGRYTGPYRDVASVRPDPKQLGDFWYLDLSARFELGQRFAPDSALWSRLMISGGARNVLNKLPEYSDSGLGFNGYDPFMYELTGRYLWVQAGLRL